MNRIHPDDGGADQRDRYERPPRSETRIQRRVRRTRRRLSEWLQEIQWLLPAGGGIVGLLLAVLLHRIEGGGNPDLWAVTVDQARSALMGWLSILFAGYGIVLAVASLTIQNVVGRFSLRMLRIYQRDLRDRIVIAIFTMTAVYILTVQTLLRSFGGDELAPPIGTAMSVVLLVLSGVAMIWYMVTITRWFRVDKISRRAAAMSLAAARGVTRAREDSEPADSPFVQPAGAVPVLAHRSGFVTDVDVDLLLDIAEESDIGIAIDRRTALAVARNEPVGWIADGTADTATAQRAALAVEISNTRELGGSIGYGIVVLVDIAIMALSPAVNDPNTAVEVIEELGFMLPILARETLGPYTMQTDSGDQNVTIYASSFADYVRVATEQIILYGKDDPFVVRALLRLANLLVALELDSADRRAVEDLRAQIEAIAAEVL